MADPMNVYFTRVRAHQTDVNGAMYHGAYFDVFDDARIETFRRLGYDYARMQSTGLRPVIRRAEAEFRTPALMDDELQITVRVVRLRAASMDIAYTCHRGDTVLAVGQVQFAFIDELGRPTRIPNDLRQVVMATPELNAAS